MVVTSTCKEEATSNCTQEVIGSHMDNWNEVQDVATTSSVAIVKFT